MPRATPLPAPASPADPSQGRCGHCRAPLPDDGTRRRSCNRTHKRKAQQQRRRREAAEAGCLSKLAFATIEAAAASGYLNGLVRAVRRCLHCPGYHLTRNTRSALVVLVRRPRPP